MRISEMKCWHSRNSFVAVAGLLSAAIVDAHTTAPTPTAVSVPVRNDWLGYDGYWSPVSIRVGTPPQWVNVLVSTVNQETWVIGPGGCDGTQKCLTERGGIFQSNESSTWLDQGTYALGLDPQLGFGDDGQYGLDSIALSDQISVPSQIVGVVNTTDYWLGFFGLGVQPTNFTSADQKTFLDSIVENKSLVPSHSYGYTAGAHYRLRSVPASLTLGGFDSNRFESHDISYDLDSDQNPVIAINEIRAVASPLTNSNVTNNWLGGSVELLGSAQADLFTIDSSTPFLWLPEVVCLQFEKALGLTYDTNLDLYTFGTNDTQHDTLVNWNITFHLAIADLPGSSKSISLTFPFAAFDLELSYPYPGLNATQYSAATKYFPLRKALNNTQFTVGRSFLQETYLKVDYERNNFSLHQATFTANPLIEMNLVDITRPKNSSFSGPQIGQATILSGGEIAGIAIASFAVCLALLGLLVMLFRRLHSPSNDGYVKEKEDHNRDYGCVSSSALLRWLLRLPRLENPTEIGGSCRFAEEAPTDREIMELPAKGPGSELEGSGPEQRGSCREDTMSGTVVNAIGHDPEEPVELPYRMSARGFVEPAPAPVIRFHRPGMPIFQKNDRSLARRSTKRTATVSDPSSARSSKRTSQHRSPVHVVSPVTPADGSPEFSSLDTVARRAAWYVSNDSHSVSSESNDGIETPQITMSIEQRAEMRTSSRHDTVSPVESSTSGSQGTVSPVQTRATNPIPRSLPRDSAITVQTSSESENSQNTFGSTVSKEIRKSVHRGFSWEPASSEATVGIVLKHPARKSPESSPLSPARWRDFWKTGRDPRKSSANGESKRSRSRAHVSKSEKS